MDKPRVFITGGASGLGLATAVKFANAGYRVCIGDINVDLATESIALLKQIDGDAFFVKCDVRSCEDLQAVGGELQVRWGGVDVLVNNAGVAGSAGDIDTVSLEDWQWVLDINVLGCVRACRTILPIMRKQGYGHIVNIASAAGLMNPPYMANYNLSKAGVISLSETLRLEVASQGIGVSVVCPGFFPTQLANSIRGGAVDSLRERINKYMQCSGVSADDVAAQIVQAVQNNQFWVHTHRLERRLWRLKRWLPQIFYRVMLNKTQNLLR